jgi:hypothetical protein
MAAFNVLVQWHGLQPNASGFVPLSIAEFSLQNTNMVVWFVKDQYQWLLHHSRQSRQQGCEPIHVYA